MTGLRGKLVAAVVAVAILALVAAPRAGAASRVFWANFSGPISFANVGGGGGGDLSESVFNLSSIAFDSVTNTMYWMNANLVDAGIPFFNLATGSGDRLSTGNATVDRPFGLAIDPAANRIYWANENSNSISFANLDGSGGNQLPTGFATVDSPEAVAIDPAANRIYWTNPSDNIISFTSLDGTGNAGNLPLSSSDVQSPQGIAIDSAAARIYWVNNAQNSIYSANLNGSAPTNVTPVGVGCPTGIALDPAAGKMYWANQCGTPGIWSANLNGTGAALVDTGGATVSMPEFPILVETPAGAGAPITAGGSTATTTLACSQGSWAPDLVGSFLYQAPASFSYGWAKDGVPIPGATTSSIAASSAGSYTCTVTATNSAGSTQQTSQAHVVASVQTASQTAGGTGPPPPPSATLASAAASDATDSLTLTCNGVRGQACAINVVGTSHERKRAGSILAVTARKRHAPTVKTVTVTVLKGSFTVSAGQGATVRVTLNNLGKQLLARFRRLPVTLSFTGSLTTARMVVFTSPVTRLRVSTPPDDWLHIDLPCSDCFTMARDVPIVGLPAGVHVTVRCQGGGCPFGRRSVTPDHGRVNIASVLGGSHLQPGTRVTVMISAPGRVSEVIVYTMQRGAGPVRTIG